MSDDEWISDAESVEQDRFNDSNFNAVKAMTDADRPVTIKGEAKPGFIPTRLPPVPTAEKEEKKEAQELEQARQIKAAVPPADQDSDGLRKPSMASITAPSNGASHTMPEVQRKPSFNGTKPSPYGRKSSANINERKESANVVARKPSFNGRKVSRNLSFNGDARKPSMNAAGRPRFASKNKFEGKYNQEVVDFFTKMNEKSITEQAIEYLNAYWDEIGDQAEFIFSVAHRIFREADMHRQGITLYYKYEEGSNVDYPTYLYFYEKLCKFVSQNPQWREGQYEKSAVYEVKTAIKHKKELQEKVDVNFDGQISFLEFLLYQYNVFSNPANFMERARMAGEEHPAIIEARLALEKVNQRIKEYEMERARLEEGAKQPGVKGLTFKHQLTVLDKSPLADELNKALITAEAAVRMAVRKFNGSRVFNAGAAANAQPRGALWWFQRDLEEKKNYRNTLAKK